MIFKLEHYGIKEKTLKWLKSYLSEQVPVLGPLLFLIYVNDLHKTTLILKPVIYADDTNLFLSNKYIKKPVNDVNFELQKISIWFKENKFCLNLTKTKWTLFHLQKNKKQKKNTLIANDLPILYIDNFEMVRESITKFLGIFIYKNVTWKYHLEHVCNKVSKSIGIMYKSRYILSKRLIKQLYFSVIYSYLKYANIA